MPGVYGTVRPANINPQDDVEIYYHYRPTRGTLDDNFGETFKLGEASWLTESSTETSDGTETKLLNGLYTLKLPMDKFSEKGIYTVYIKPKEHDLKIVDVSILENYTNPLIEGIVINRKDVDGKDVTGYRIEYYDDTNKVTDTVRLVTSCNPCMPVKVSLGDTYARTTRYRINNVSSEDLYFLTLTPSSSSSYKPNVAPSPGYVGQTIHVINTKFNPVMLEIEMVDHDADTISTMLEGDQIRDLDHGLITTYDENKQIYKQHEYYTLKSKNGTPIYDVKALKSPSEMDVDGQAYDNIIER